LTGEEIRLHAEQHTEGETILTTLALKFINECLVMDLGKEARVVKTSSPAITATANTWYALPTDILEIFEIEQAGQDDPYYGTRYGTAYTGRFDLRDGYISFLDAGTYTVRYYAVPAPIATLADTPVVHALFHYPISLYVASRYKSNDDEENPDAHRLMGEYRAYRQKAIEELARTRPTTRASRRIKARAWS
jgi:hypothetical protein